jgi:competence protein ComEA
MCAGAWQLGAMPELSRTQVLVYGAVAVALLLVGARAIRADGAGEYPPPVAAAGSGAGSVSIESGGGDLVVDVAGAVRSPGVYRLPQNARVVDAIGRAGGPAAGALVEAINRAARLTDGQQVVVPERAPDGAPATISGPAAEDGPIGLGSATVEQLESIDGIGPVTAGKIVEYRDSKGGLASVEQLDEVSGIGPATLDSLRARLQP